MLLSDRHERDRRIAALAFDYDAAPKHQVAACNLCGCDVFVVLTQRDRYGYPAQGHCCRRCGLVFLNPRLTAEAYAEFYSDIYRPLVSAYHGRRIDAETVEEEQAAYGQALADALAPFLSSRRQVAHLDVGGSTGVVAQVLADRFGVRPTILDPAPAEIARAAARGMETIVGTIEDYDAEGRAFELVTLCQTVDHLLDVSASLRKLRALLADDGLLFVDIVDFRAAYLRNWSVEEAMKIDHPFSLTEATAEAFLPRAGLRIVRTIYEADGLHVGYVCVPADPDVEALPPPETVDRLLREIRYAQNAPRP